MNATTRVECLSPRRIQVDPYLTVPEEGLLDWLDDNRPKDATWLLAHTYAGVIWGRLDEKWKLSSDVAGEISPPLDPPSLLQLRVFGPTGELFVWRSDTGLQGRCVIINSGQEYESYCEDWWLWGTAGKPLDENFTLLSDGVQGLRHAVPLESELPFGKDDRTKRPGRLQVEHFLRRDPATGLAEVWLSRLVDLYWAPEAQEVSK